MTPRQSLAAALAALKGTQAEVITTDARRHPDEQAAIQNLEQARAAWAQSDAGVAAAREALSRVPSGQLHFAARNIAEQTLSVARAAAARAHFEGALSMDEAQFRLDAASTRVAAVREFDQYRWSLVAAAENKVTEAIKARDQAVKAVLADEGSGVVAEAYAVAARFRSLRSTAHLLGLDLGPQAITDLYAPTPDLVPGWAPIDPDWQAAADALKTDHHAPTPGTDPRKAAA